MGLIGDVKLYLKLRKARNAVIQEAKVQGFSVPKMVGKGIWSFILTGVSAAVPAVIAWASQPENVQQALAQSGWSPATIGAVAGIITALVRMLANWYKNQEK